MSTYLTKPEVEAVKQLGLLASLRGMDSTGIVVGKNRNLRQGPTYSLYKHTIPSQEFLWDDEIDNIMSSQSFLIMGHCRSATIGGVTQENAQPFIKKHILGCHNGTINALTPMDKEDKRSDSSVFFDLLAERGLEGALQQVGFGAYAFVWVDSRTNCIHFLRNSQRPLWFMTNHGSNTVYWSSEKIMLEFVKKRMDFGYFKEPQELPVDHLLTVDLMGNSFAGDLEPCAPRKEPVNNKPPVVTSQQVTHRQQKYYHRSAQAPDTTTEKQTAIIPWRESDWERALREHDEAEAHAKAEANRALAEEKQQSAALLKEEKAETKKERHEPLAYFRAWEGHQYGVTFAIKNLSNGCFLCNKVALLNEESWWFSRHDYVCASCKNRGTWFVNDYMKKMPFYGSSIVGDIEKEVEAVLGGKYPEVIS